MAVYLPFRRDPSLLAPGPLPATRLALVGSGRFQLEILHCAADQVGRLVERNPFILVQFQLDNALDAGATQHHRHAEADVIQAILTLQIDRGRDDLAFVAHDSLSHTPGRRAGCVVRAARLEVLHDLRTAVARAFDDALDLLVA